MKQETSRDALPQVRCARCHRLLLRGFVQRAEIKCPKCGALHMVENCKREA